jgi:hypothetical protein
VPSVRKSQSPVAKESGLTLFRARQVMASMKVDLIEKRALIPGDRLFAPVNDLLIMLSAIAHAGSLMTDGSTHKEAKPTMRLRTSCLDHDFALPLRGPFEHALEGTMPDRIEIGLQKRNGSLLENPKVVTKGLASVMTHITAPYFIIVFDRYIHSIGSQFGEVRNWPPILNFARVVRNAAAHGKVKFDNPNAQAVSWRNLTYSPLDNGRQLIGGDMQLGDVLGLSFDVSDELDALQIPIL